MKTIIKLIGAVAFIAGLYSCSALDVEIDTVVQADLDLASEAETTKSGLATYSFSGSETLNAMDDPEVEKYANKIKNYNVNSIKAEVTYVSAKGVVLLKDSYFKIHDLSDEVMWPLAEDFNVAVGETYTFSSATGDFETVQKILMKNSEFTISGTGFTNTPSVKITLNSKLDVTVTANPLN